MKMRIPALALLFLGSALAQGPPTMYPPVRGLHEMVGAANNFEVEAGYRILTSVVKPFLTASAARV